MARDLAARCITGCRTSNDAENPTMHPEFENKFSWQNELRKVPEKVVRPWCTGAAGAAMAAPAAPVHRL